MVATPKRLAPPIEPKAGPRQATVPGPRPGRPALVALTDADALVAQAIAAGAADPRRPADRLLAAADRDRERLERAASVLIQRLTLRSNDLEATLALRIVERALAAAPYPDGPWRWHQRLSPRRIRATRRRAARRRFRDGRQPTKRPRPRLTRAHIDQEGV
jgi:hypothetical protein